MERGGGAANPSDSTPSDWIPFDQAPIDKLIGRLLPRVKGDW
jgi:hypothetical protein